MMTGRDRGCRGDRCAGYILHYLLRLEPFTKLALALQGGRFDKADRLFRDVRSSWESASRENLQDVRELTPEFFNLPEFLVNSNGFDFGFTQKGQGVHDVVLPPWAKGDPAEFIRLHRKALESPHVSKNLHSWIGLIFGCKQRGPEAVEAQNVFVHLTYEGEVDIDSIQIAGVGVGAIMLPKSPDKYLRFGGPSRGVSFFQTAGGGTASSSKATPDRLLSSHESLHLTAVTASACSVDGSLLLTGALDGTCRLWSVVTLHGRSSGLGQVSRMLDLAASLGRHAGPVTCATVGMGSGSAVTGGADGKVLVWDIRRKVGNIPNEPIVNACVKFI
ncbi:unnamed protein product [Ectocarpus sp. CCAP 1310/34]|nr:unnamed protein product [Ectocarpus sp. CCAP 1310/34]